MSSIATCPDFLNVSLQIFIGSSWFDLLSQIPIVFVIAIWWFGLFCVRPTPPVLFFNTSINKVKARHRADVHVEHQLISPAILQTSYFWTDCGNRAGLDLAWMGANGRASRRGCCDLFGHWEHFAVIDLAHVDRAEKRIFSIFGFILICT